MDDWRLLRQYCDDGSQAAFRQLAQRHLKMVYWTCRRDLGSDQAAEDAAQAVFLLLAQKARSLPHGTQIPGWLFSTARLVCKNIARSDARRRHYEQEAIMRRQNAAQEAGWQQVEPWINDGLSALSAGDRNVLLLHYFEGLTLSEVARVTGASESAAKMRVSRALARLRGYLQAKDVAVSSMLLPTLLAEHSTEAVPAHVAAHIYQSAGVLTSSSLAPPVSGGVAIGRSGFLLAKGILIVSTSKIIAAAGAAAVVAILLITAFAVHKLHSQPPAFVWQAPPAASASDQQAQQQIRQELDQSLSSWNAGDLQGMLAFYSPNYVDTENGHTFSYQDTKRDLTDNMRRGERVQMNVLSCSISGNTATAVVQLRVHYLEGPQPRPVGGPETITFANISGRWLVTASSL